MEFYAGKNKKFLKKEPLEKAIYTLFNRMLNIFLISLWTTQTI